MRDYIIIGKQEFPTLVAITPEEHEQGLMYKQHPVPNMCFPYNQASLRKFWMKNCLAPLDIIFCRDNKVVSVCYGEPMSTRLIGPNDLSDFVIELPYGTAKKYNIRIGTEIQFKPSTKTIGRSLKSAIQRIF